MCSSARFQIPHPQILQHRAHDSLNSRCLSSTRQVACYSLSAPYCHTIVGISHYEG